MKIVMQQIEEGEEELILRYREMNAQTEAILRLAEGMREKLSGMKAGCSGEIFLINPEEVYYFESVDKMTYAYLKNGIFRLRESLNELLAGYESRGFFRCSRTMLVNIYRVEHLKSEPAGRILATLNNGEKIIISRKYAKEFRTWLRRGREEAE